MKKLLITMSLVSSFVLHAAAEKQKFVRELEKVSISGKDYDFIEIERVHPAVSAEALCEGWKPVEGSLFRLMIELWRNSLPPSPPWQLFSILSLQ